MKHFLKLEEYCRSRGFDYTDQQDEQFAAFCDQMIEKNKVMNLTAITDPKDIEIKHFIDSVESIEVINGLFKDHDPKSDFSIMDIGTGAGFPGIPLAIMFPEIKFTLADSLDKRIGFIKETVKICGLKNIEAVHGRAEDLGRSVSRETFDICVSRAVAAMPVLLEYCLPFVKVGGTVVLYKSGSYAEEMEASGHALSVLGGQMEDVKSFYLPYSEIERSLVVICKIASTPGKYPRKAGKPTKSPL